MQNTAPPPLTLYVTSACHLCELAEQVLQELGVAPEMVEIVDDAQLLERYGMRIPVLRAALWEAELDWPFAAQQVQQWLSALR